MKAVSIFAMSRKGYVVLRDMIGNGLAECIDMVVIAHDHNMANDYFEELQAVCHAAGIRVYERHDAFSVSSPFCFAISWRWMIPLDSHSRLIVFHDSLLPRYRGFAPLVNMLINREPAIGVTALFASSEYDRGHIIAQRQIAVVYPIKISDAIDLITPLYAQMAVEITNWIRNGQTIPSVPQDEAQASYSLWRDEDDYRIDWNAKADDIRQFVYSVGYPYKGASTMAGDTLLRIMDCETQQDVAIENRTPGKVLFVTNGLPVVVCRDGLLKITDLRDENGESMLPLKKFRIKFH